MLSTIGRRHAAEQMESILDGEEDPAPKLPRQDQSLEDDGGPWSDAFGVGSRVVVLFIGFCKTGDSQVLVH